ncbi:MAG: PrgI family protein [Patescibacteria group bacterium]|nr:PrgI family protein [Patescibacteria group bacterium]
MRFIVPQFIEMEAKIVGPLTFRQFVFVGIAGAACFVFYFILPFYLFLISCFVLGGIALAFAFLKISSRDLPTILKNSLIFFLKPKIYLWRKGAPLKFFKKEVIKKEKVEEVPSLKVAGESKLRRLSTQVETKTK